MRRISFEGVGSAVKNVLCLVIDGLGAGALGCYGNTWLETPALDRLASESFVLDQVVSDSCELSSVYRSWWQALPALVPQPEQAPSLVERLGKAGLATWLLTDDSEVAMQPLAAGFDRSIILPVDVPSVPAKTIGETHAARFFAAAVEVLSEMEGPNFCWMHWQGLLGPWDAPLEFRQRLADEEDPTPPESTDVPNLVLPEGYDPDQLLGIMQSYGGQVMLLDECFGAFWEQFRADPRAEDTLIMLCSPRGFPLGEHRVVGLSQDESGRITGTPYSEFVHVPWLIRHGDLRGSLERSASLAQPADLSPTVLDALSIEDGTFGRWGRVQAPGGRSNGERERDRIGIQSVSHRGLRTAYWHFVEPRGEPPEEASTSDDVDDRELYVKPDDRWEVNNVARLCYEEAEQLQKATRDLEETSIAGDSSSPSSSLPDVPSTG